MSIVERLGKLSDEYDKPFEVTYQIYLLRVKVIGEAYKKKFEGRETHIFALAHRGMEMYYKQQKILKDVK